MTCFAEYWTRLLGAEHGHVVLSSDRGRKQLEYMLVKACPVNSYITTEKSLLLPQDRVSQMKGGRWFLSRGL
jgi:ferredoxin-like protein FixX